MNSDFVSVLACANRVSGGDTYVNCVSLEQVEVARDESQKRNEAFVFRKNLLVCSVTSLSFLGPHTILLLNDDFEAKYFVEVFIGRLPENVYILS